jgi:hypothetical protein
MTKFKAERVPWRVEAKITPVEVERETESSVWINGNRRAKITEWDTFHDTWDEAHAHLLKHAEQQAQSARRNLEAANGSLGNVKGMKRPE